MRPSHSIPALSSRSNANGASHAAYPRHLRKTCLLSLLATGIIAAPSVHAADNEKAYAGPMTSYALPGDPGGGSATAKPKPDFSANTASYKLPAFEIIGAEVLLNLVNRHYLTPEYKSNMRSIRSNLRSRWVVDDDPFATNQLGHPYMGSMYHGFARSAGLTYWESLGYTFAGSALWEIAGETSKPSRNDQIATGIGGTFLGEALFRLSSLMVEHSGGGATPLWRELAAAAISPSTGFNRHVFREHGNVVFDSHDPGYYSRLQLGFSGAARTSEGTSLAKLHRNEILGDYSIDYGLPGKPGYTYDRPFDYFNLQASASTANGFENVMTRGMLVGRSFAEGTEYRGILGLFGSYDYIAPQIFRISSTALSLGSTGEYRISDAMAFQSSVLLGVGYAAVGTTRGALTEENYHYGVAPQMLIAARLIFAQSGSLDLTAREYFVSSPGTGHDNIVRVDASYTQRVSGRHALTVKYLGNRRDAYFPTTGTNTQSRATIGIFYTLLGQDGFGHVDW